jgi:AraC-like DNA-binding protein
MSTINENPEGSLQLVLESLVSRGVNDIASASRLLGTSSRTLQRRLAARGTTFSGVLAQARLHLAQKLLDDPSFKVIDVAYDVGYSDPSHFTKAFRRWTGMSPRAYRADLGSPGPTHPGIMRSGPEGDALLAGS